MMMIVNPTPAALTRILPLWKVLTAFVHLVECHRTSQLVQKKHRTHWFPSLRSKTGMGKLNRFEEFQKFEIRISNSEIVQTLNTKL